MIIITIPYIAKLFECTDRTALKHLNQARTALGKRTNNGNGRKGGEPVTVEQFNEVFGLTKTLTK